MAELRRLVDGKMPEPGKIPAYLSDGTLGVVLVHCEGRQEDRDLLWDIAKAEDRLTDAEQDPTGKSNHAVSAAYAAIVAGRHQEARQWIERVEELISHAEQPASVRVFLPDAADLTVANLAVCQRLTGKVDLVELFPMQIPK